MTLDTELLSALADAERRLASLLEALRGGDSRAAAQKDAGLMSVGISAWRERLSQRGVRVPPATVDLGAFRQWPAAVKAESVDPSFLDVTLPAVCAVDWRGLLGLSDVGPLRRALICGAVFGCNEKTAIGALGEALGLESSAARRMYETALGITTQAARLDLSGVLGFPSSPDDVFRYGGPIDLQIRPFCLERVGRVYTRRMIEQMNSAELPQVLLTRGGWECRHVWEPVSTIGPLAETPPGEYASARDRRTVENVRQALRDRRERLGEAAERDDGSDREAD